MHVNETIGNQKEVREALDKTRLLLGKMSSIYNRIALFIIGAVKVWPMNTYDARGRGTSHASHSCSGLRI